MEHKKWEYLRECEFFDSNTDEEIDFLTAKGLEGWELVSRTEYSDAVVQEVQHFFKRAIINKVEQ